MLLDERLLLARGIRLCGGRGNSTQLLGERVKTKRHWNSDRDHNVSETLCICELTQYWRGYLMFEGKLLKAWLQRRKWPAD